MKNIKILTIVYIFFVNCSAANIWNVNNPTSNTNPTPEYNNYNFLLYRGGFLFHMNKMPGNIGDNAKAKLIHSGCNYSILLLASFGDSSIDTITNESKITRISYVSYEQLAILSFVFHRFCTTVAGE